MRAGVRHEATNLTRGALGTTSSVLKTSHPIEADPVIRTCKDGRIVKRVDDELVIYDEHSHKVFHLNRAAAIVWEHCDDASSPEDLALTLASRSGLPASEELANLALQDLRDAGLIEGSFASAPGREVARRDVVTRIAGLALALPIVVSLLAPTPAMAASGGDPKGPYPKDPQFPPPVEQHHWWWWGWWR